MAPPYVAGFRHDKKDGAPREYVIPPTGFARDRRAEWNTGAWVQPLQLWLAAGQHGLSWLVGQVVGERGLKPAVHRLGLDFSYTSIWRRLTGRVWFGLGDAELCLQFNLPADAPAHVAETQQVAVDVLNEERLRPGRPVPARAYGTFRRVLRPRPVAGLPGSWLASEPNAAGQPFQLLGVRGLGVEPPVLHRRSIEDLQRYALLHPASMQVSEVLRGRLTTAARELALEPALTAVLDLHRRAAPDWEPGYGLVVSLRIWIANDWEPVRLGTVRPPAQQGGAPDPAEGRPRTAASAGNEQLLVEVLPDAQPGQPEAAGVLDDYEIDVQLALSRDWLANVAYGIGPAVDGLFIAGVRSFDGAGRARQVTVLDLGVDCFGDPAPALAAAKVMWSEDGPHLELLSPAEM